MKLICPNKHEWNVQTRYWWKVKRCRVEKGKCPECGKRGRPDEAGKEELAERWLSINLDKKRQDGG